MLKKEIFTAKELELRPLGKVIIFRVKQNLPIIYRFVIGCLKAKSSPFSLMEVVKNGNN